jgi:hypothetical protein
LACWWYFFLFFLRCSVSGTILLRLRTLSVELFSCPLFIVTSLPCLYKQSRRGFFLNKAEQLRKQSAFIRFNQIIIFVDQRKGKNLKKILKKNYCSNVYSLRCRHKCPRLRDCRTPLQHRRESRVLGAASHALNRWRRGVHTIFPSLTFSLFFFFLTLPY